MIRQISFKAYPKKGYRTRELPGDAPSILQPGARIKHVDKYLEVQ